LHSALAKAVQIEIVASENEGSTTYYNINVSDTTHSWKVKKRYGEFLELNKELASRSVLTREQLPAKGLFGFRHRFDIGNFNKQRQTGLDSYLKNLGQQVTTLREDPVLQAFLSKDDMASKKADSVGGSQQSLPANANEEENV